MMISKRTTLSFPFFAAVIVFIPLLRKHHTDYCWRSKGLFVEARRMTKANRGKKAKKKKEGNDSSRYIWTKRGLEQIAWEHWKYFEIDGASKSSKRFDCDDGIDQSKSFYLKSFPFPGDAFTYVHLDAWNTYVDQGGTVKTNVSQEATFKTLLKNGFIAKKKDMIEVMKIYDDYTKIPTLFSDPIILQETPIDYRMQFAADIGSNMIEESAAMGRLVNPAGRRLREHYYRFPDQCDATPIALEVFLRLMIYDQVEAFFHEKRIGLWHDLFLEVSRRPYNQEELSVARWYGERYAESYVHQIRNGWVYPLGSIQNIDTYMIAVGLDPHDPTEDHNTPAGLGNLIGRRVTEWMAQNDGLKKDMDFVDVEGLERIDDYHPNQSWFHWKPALAGSSRFQGIRNGIVTRQTFVSPSLGIFSFLYQNETDFLGLNLENAVPILDQSESAYIEKSMHFLDVHATMGDYEKAVAELANNKISASVFLIVAYVPLLRSLASEEDFSDLYDEFSMVTSGCAEYAAAHVVWRHKRTYLAGRPQTILRHLANTNESFAEKYPQAKTFEPMINPSGDHPEYPSGSTAIFSAFAQAADNWFDDVFNLKDASRKTGPLTFTVPKAKFYWSDGPAEDITLEYENLNQWIEELPLSRVYGGVHFLDSGIAGVALGKEVGHACSRLLSRLRDGDMSATYTFEQREHINAFNGKV